MAKLAFDKPLDSNYRFWAILVKHFAYTNTPGQYMGRMRQFFFDKSAHRLSFMRGNTVGTVGAVINI
jgi:hypothetical protein